MNIDELWYTLEHYYEKCVGSDAVMVSLDGADPQPFYEFVMMCVIAVKK
jgi:hypothetical protein